MEKPKIGAVKCADSKRSRLAAFLVAILATVMLPLAAHAKQDSLPGLGVQPTEYFYTGKPYDSDTGSYTFKYRNYDPELNRWTTKDPSGFPNGANNWNYANNMVMTHIDSLGLDIYHINNPNAVKGLGHSGAIVGSENGGGYDYYSYDDSNQVTPEHFSTRDDAFNYSKDNGYTRAEKWLAAQYQDDAARSAANAYNNTQYDAQNHNCWDMVNDMLTDADRPHVDRGPGPNINYDENTQTCWEIVIFE
ncbi:MAG: hypothetical protein M0Q93_01460 [Terrimicrobiaceae bacterium]|nr:hypothetical protein [Terrimicrobiaceae bacterium]